MWADLSRGDEVVLTSNGKPSALVIGIPEDGFDEIIQAVRQAKAVVALNSMRMKAEKAGYMSDDDIEAMIASCTRPGDHVAG